MATKAIARRRRRWYGPARRTYRRAKHMTLPIGPLAGLMVGLWPVIDRATKGDFDGAMKTAAYRYTGYDAWNHKWSVNNMKMGILPLAIGGIVHRVVGKDLGINRALSSAGVPFFRI